MTDKTVSACKDCGWKTIPDVFGRCLHCFTPTHFPMAKPGEMACEVCIGKADRYYLDEDGLKRWHCREHMPTNPPTETTVEKWEREFENEFGKDHQEGSSLDLYDFYDGGVYEDIKDFIRTLLSSSIERARQEEREAERERMYKQIGEIAKYKQVRADMKMSFVWLVLQMQSLSLKGDL